MQTRKSQKPKGKNVESRNERGQETVLTRGRVFIREPTTMAIAEETEYCTSCLPSGYLLQALH